MRLRPMKEKNYVPGDSSKVTFIFQAKWPVFFLLFGTNNLWCWVQHYHLKTLVTSKWLDFAILKHWYHRVTISTIDVDTIITIVGGFNPSEKICSSNGIMKPQFSGENKIFWNHHLDNCCYHLKLLGTWVPSETWHRVGQSLAELLPCAWEQMGSNL